LKLKKQHRQLLEAIVRGKGIARTKLVPREKTEDLFNPIMDLYLAKVIQFSRKSEYEFEGPKKEPRYKCWEIKPWPRVTINDLKKALKVGVYEKV